VNGTAVTFSPIGTADGVLIVIVTAIAVGLALSRSVAESRTRTLQVILAILGAAAVIIWLGSIGGERRMVVDGIRPRWDSTSGIGIGVAAVGVALLFVTGAILSLRAWRSNGILADPSDPAVTGQSIVRAAIEVGAGLLGFVVGLAAVLTVAGPYALAPMAFAAFFGAAIGMALGNRVGSLL
jgi:hypothetical protein